MAPERQRVDNEAYRGVFPVVATAALVAALLAVLLAYGAAPWMVAAAGAAGAALVALLIAYLVLPLRLALAERRSQAAYAQRLEQALAAAMRRLQAGDLSAGESLSADLPHALAGSLAGAKAAIAALVQQIQAASVEVAAAAGTVQGNAGELACASTEQAAAVVELTATTEELARTAAQIAASAATQAEAAARAEESGDAGAAAVGEAVGGVEAVIARIGAIAGRTDALATRSREIYKVLDLITEIARETHILSLNAAIEASAAGEHGRRFGVVADEVRRLAQRSRESVDSVRAMLEEFAASTRATAVATEEGSKEGARVLERARSAAAAIDELRGALAHTAQAAREISLATEQQRTASDQVAITLKEVSQVVQRMAEGLRTFSDTAERLNQLALTIQLLTQAFRTPSSRSLKHLAAGWAADLERRAGHWEAVDAHLAELVRSHPWIELAYLVDGHGTMVALASSAEAAGSSREASITPGTSCADRPWFKSVQRDRRTILTPLYESMLTGGPCFTIAVPVWGDGERLDGVLGVDVNVRDWTRI